MAEWTPPRRHRLSPHQDRIGGTGGQHVGGDDLPALEIQGDGHHFYTLRATAVGSFGDRRLHGLAENAPCGEEEDHHRLAALRHEGIGLGGDGLRERKVDGLGERISTAGGQQVGDEEDPQK